MGGIKYTPSNTSGSASAGSSTAFIVQPLNLTGANNGGTLIMVNSINSLGVITATNYYEPVGMTLTVLPPGTASVVTQTELDVYPMLLQDSVTKFIREYFIADGGATAYTKDITLAGAPYVAIGSVTAPSAGDASAANQLAINNNISTSNSYLNGIFGTQNYLVSKKFRPANVFKYIIAAGANVNIDSVTFVVAAYRSGVGTSLTMAELGVLTGGSNFAIVSPAELANFNKVLPTIELFNTALAATLPTSAIRSWNNPNAFEITLIGVQYF